MKKIEKTQETDDDQKWIGLVSYGIFMVSFVSILGSLYYQYFGDPVANLFAGVLFSHGKGLYPCVLCWYARILMYPIAPITFVGMVTRDRTFVKYVLPLSIMGIVLELYHYALQMLPIQNFIECNSYNPCNAKDIIYAGFITIPFLCLVAFVMITGASVWVWKKNVNRC